MSSCHAKNVYIVALMIPIHTKSLFCVVNVSSKIYAIVVIIVLTHSLINWLKIFTTNNVFFFNYKNSKSSEQKSKHSFALAFFCK